MLIYKIIGIGLCAAVLSQLIKQYRPEVAIAIPITATVLIIALCFPHLASLIEIFDDIANQTGINTDHIKIVLKITGVAYICQFASDICRDVGETSIASKIELGGKIIIISLSMPIMYSMLEIVNKIINF